MSAEDQLRKALGLIDRKVLAAEFLADGAAVTAVAAACERLALWTNVLRTAEPENLAAPFLFEMQRSSHDVAALLASAFYVPAAAAMRAACETALYYTYFRNHAAELTTLAMNPEYFISKAEVLDFHKQHSPHYRRVTETSVFRASWTHGIAAYRRLFMVNSPGRGDGVWRWRTRSTSRPFSKWHSQPLPKELK